MKVNREELHYSSSDKQLHKPLSQKGYKKAATIRT